MSSERREVPVGELFAFIVEHEGDESLLLEQGTIVADDGQRFVVMMPGAAIALLWTPLYDSIIDLKHRADRGREPGAAEEAASLLTLSRTAKDPAKKLELLRAGIALLGCAQLARLDVPATWLSKVEVRSETMPAQPGQVLHHIGLRSWNLPGMSLSLVGRSLSFTISWDTAFLARARP